MKPTEVQIVSVKGVENHLKTNGSRMFDKNEVIVSEDTLGHKKYTIRADRMYRAECRSKGSRPLATIEWYLLKKNQRYNVGRSANGTVTLDAAVVPPGEKLGGASVASEGAIVGTVETLQVSDMFLKRVVRAGVAGLEHLTCLYFFYLRLKFHCPGRLYVFDVTGIKLPLTFF